MSRLLALVAALFLAGCSAPCPDCGARPVAETLFVTQPESGVSALATLGGRDVRLLYVRPPSIVLLREVFLPEGESVKAVRWADDGRALIIETEAARFALDARRGHLAQIQQHARDVATFTHARRRG